MASKDVPDMLKRAASSLLKWRGVDAMGGKDVLAWVMKDGTYGFAIQGPALRFETRCFGESYPIRNRQDYAWMVRDVVIEWQQPSTF